MSNTTEDPRPDSLKAAMAEGWEEHEDEYRDDMNYEGSEVVYEDEELVIVADHSHSGRELDRCVSGHDVPRRVVRNWMLDVAQERADYDWSESDALVFAKSEADDE